jgi:hypothetical protein
MTFRVRGSEAEEELHAARDQADLTLPRLGAFLLYQGEAVPHKPLRRLYGEYPRPAFGCHRRRSGLRTNEVGRCGVSTSSAVSERCSRSSAAPQDSVDNGLTPQVPGNKLAGNRSRLRGRVQRPRAGGAHDAWPEDPFGRDHRAG